MKLWLLLTPLLPLLFAVALFFAREYPCVTRWAIRLAPLSLLPALVLALAAPDATTLYLDALLLGTQLGLDATGRVFLLLSALAWMSATLYAQTLPSDDPRRGRFFGFFLATAAGNFGVCLAQDLLSFYWLFALMTVSAWPLVLHIGSPMARRAGLVYLAFTVLGETALLMALLLISPGGDLALANVPATLAASPWRDTIVTLLLIGFGVKIGVFGLHMSLPLAYEASPIPGAAVLASAMIKVGLLGWLRFLPLGHALPDWGTVLVLLGLVAAFYAVIVGLLQQAPKVILAYSSISQMGLISIGVGVGLHTPAVWPVMLPAVLWYALHHALAKGALFLGVGLARSAEGLRRGVLAGLVLLALAIAGAPLTAGALAKQALKDAAAPTVWGGPLGSLLMWASLGTTLLMVRFLWCMTRAQGSPHSRAPRRAQAAWWFAAAVALLPSVWLPLVDAVAFEAPPFAWQNAALWPVFGGALIAYGVAVIARRRQWVLPTVAAGDLLWPLLALGKVLWPVVGRLRSRSDVAARPPSASMATPLKVSRAEGLEGRLRSSALAGALLLLCLALLIALLTLHTGG